MCLEKCWNKMAKNVQCFRYNAFCNKSSCYCCFMIEETDFVNNTYTVNTVYMCSSIGMHGAP